VANVGAPVEGSQRSTGPEPGPGSSQLLGTGSHPRSAGPLRPRTPVWITLGQPGVRAVDPEVAVLAEGLDDGEDRGAHLVAAPHQGPGPVDLRRGRGGAGRDRAAAGRPDPWGS